MTSHDDDLPAVERTCVLGPGAGAPRSTDGALGALALVRHPSLVPLLRSQPAGDGHALTHLVPVGAVPLAELRARTPLRPGHVATVALAVLDALDALHRAGLAHGAVDPAHVLVAPDGRVLLDGAGLAWSVPAGEPGGPTPAEDVAGVALLLRDLLGPGTAPPALVLAALRAADSDPRARPDAVDLAASLRSAVPPEPLLDLLWAAAAAGAAPLARPPEPWPSPVASAPGLAARDGAPGRTARDAERDAPGPAQGPVSAAEAAPAPGGPRHPEDRGVPRSGARRSGLRPGRRPRRARLSSRAARPPASRLRSRGGTAAVVVLALLALVRVAVLATADARPSPVASPGSGRSGSSAATVPAQATAVIAAGSAGAALPATSGPSDATAPAAAGSAGATSAAPASTGPVQALPAGAVDWSAVLARLDTGRRAALESGAGLAEWVDPAGPAYAADQALLARLRASGARLEGGALRRLSVIPMAVDAVQARLRVRDVREAYAVVSGGRRERVAERPARWWWITLRAGAHGWRVLRVEPGAQ